MGGLAAGTTEWVAGACIHTRTQPSLRFKDSEPHFMTREICGVRRAGLNRERTFAATAPAFEAKVGAARKRHKCDQVCLVGWNLIATDARCMG